MKYIINVRMNTTQHHRGASDSDCYLTFVNKEDGTEKQMDCSMFGASRFLQLLDDLGIGSNDEPQKVVTEKK